MMFKWSKAKRANGEPTTPMIGCAQLPETFSPIPILPAMKPGKHSFWSRFTPDNHRRSESARPQPLLFQADPHSSLSRTMSMGDNDVVIHKPIPIKPTSIKPVAQAPKSILKKTSKYDGSSTTSLPLERKPSPTEHSEQVLKPLKSAMKGGSFQQVPTVYVKPTIPSPDSSSQSSTSPIEPGDMCSGCHNQRKRIHSLQEQRPVYTTSNRTPKYMKAYIKEVSMKDEAIALSWPLVDYAARRNKGTPMLYFDIGFDPRQDEWAVRVYRGGYASPMTWEESHVPVSPHTVLTEMVIVCTTPVSAWELIIQRTRGVRVIDVFRQIFNTFNNVLTEAEKALIDPRYLDRCLPAFKQRCRDCPGLTLYNENCGMRRVDLLRGRRIFKGLSPILGKPGFWQLHFDEPPHSQA